MKLDLRTILGVTLFGLASYAAYAESVAVSTFYPSPFGSYQNLTVTGTLTSATENVTTLNVAGNATVTGTLTADNASNVLRANTLTAATATVSGNLNLTSGGNSGNLQVSCTGGNCYAVYA